MRFLCYCNYKGFIWGQALPDIEGTWDYLGIADIGVLSFRKYNRKF